MLRISVIVATAYDMALRSQILRRALKKGLGFHVTSSQAHAV